MNVFDWMSNIHLNFHNNGNSCVWYTSPEHRTDFCVPICEREQNNNIRIKLYRAYTIEFLTQFNELFFFIFPIILGMEIGIYINTHKYSDPNVIHNHIKMEISQREKFKLFLADICCCVTMLDEIDWIIENVYEKLLNFHKDESIKCVSICLSHIGHRRLFRLEFLFLKMILSFRLWLAHSIVICYLHDIFRFLRNRPRKLLKCSVFLWNRNRIRRL